MESPSPGAPSSASLLNVALCLRGLVLIFEDPFLGSHHFRESALRVCAHSQISTYLPGFIHSCHFQGDFVPPSIIIPSSTNLRGLPKISLHTQLIVTRSSWFYYLIAWFTPCNCLNDFNILFILSFLCSKTLLGKVQSLPRPSGPHASTPTACSPAPFPPIPSFHPPNSPTTQTTPFSLASPVTVYWASGTLQSRLMSNASSHKALPNNPSCLCLVLNYSSSLGAYP